MSAPRSKKSVKPHGQIRQSQVVTTFGPDSMVDLPKSSVIIAGLEYWDKGEQILEPRLVDNLKGYFEKHGIKWKDSQKWPWMDIVERIVLVHRLREVIAQVGFTRFESSSPDVQGELEMGVVQAPLSREVSWLPAIENRGEGVFIQIRSDAIEKWRERKEVQSRGRKLNAGFDCWRADHKQSKRVFPGLPYLFLHSLSHLLISAVSLECGYPSSSIRERIYPGGGGYGILLYTGSPDSEGTMGGLVEAGRQIARHLKAAIDLAQLCSNDPVCANISRTMPTRLGFCTALPVTVAC